MWFTLVWHWVKCWETVHSLSEFFLLMLLKSSSLVMQFCDIIHFLPSTVCLCHQRLCETVCSQKRKERKKKKHIRWNVLKSFERKVTYLFTEDCSAVHTHLFIEHQYLIIWLCCEVHLRAQLHPAYLTSLLRCACCWPFLAVLCPELRSCFWLVIDIKKLNVWFDLMWPCVVFCN